MHKVLLTVLICLLFSKSWAQTEADTSSLSSTILDSLFIMEVESTAPHQKPKVLHAEPLYIDLIRDLGARKGEKEWNVGLGLTDRDRFDEYEALVEYEWAPVDRLGFEVEVPVTLYSPRVDLENGTPRPSNRIESLKLATQWTFLVSEKQKTSLALGYIHEFEMVDLNQIKSDNLLQGNIYNPFFIAAKRWGSNYHTLIYTGPRIEKEFGHQAHFRYEIHTNFHYMVSGTRNFIGIEFNKEIYQGNWDVVMRPQMRVALAENLMVGIVTGIPLKKPDERMSSFIRVIYEPNFKAMH